jgi:hypothetical protein
LGVLEVRADFPAYPGVTVKVRMFDAGRLVGTYHVPQGVIGRLSLAPPGPGAGEGEAGDPVPGLEVTVVQVPGGGPVQLSSRSTLQIGGTIALTGDTLMLAPDCSACDIETIESIAITGSGLNTIVIADVVTEAPPELPDLARIELRTVDAAGNHLDAVEPGDTFVLEAYATDLRPVPGGVFAAYVDVLFDATLVAIDGPLTIGDQFPIARSGDTTTAGLLDEVGGSGGLEPNAGDGLLFRVLLQAADLGRVDFQANEADQLPLHHVLLRESDDAVPAARVQFVGTSLIVRHPPWSNFDNPTDVNGDGTTAPIDVLLLINEINRRSISDPATGALPEPGGAVVPPPYLDVNGDRALTPIDVLIVINRLNGMGQQAGGEGEAFAFPAELHPAPSQPFAASPLRTLISTAGPSRPPAAFPTIPQDVRDGSRHPQAYHQPPARPVQEFGEGRDGELEKVIGEIVGDVATAWMA